MTLPLCDWEPARCFTLPLLVLWPVAVALWGRWMMRDRGDEGEDTMNCYRTCWVWLLARGIHSSRCGIEETP